MLDEAKREIADCKRKPTTKAQDYDPSEHAVGEWILENKGIERWIKKTSDNMPMP